MWSIFRDAGIMNPPPETAALPGICVALGVLRQCCGARVRDPIQPLPRLILPHQRGEPTRLAGFILYLPLSRGGGDTRGRLGYAIESPPPIQFLELAAPDYLEKGGTDASEGGPAEPIWTTRLRDLTQTSPFWAVRLKSVDSALA